MPRLIKTIRLLWTFYKSFLVLSILVDIACVWTFYRYGYSFISTVLIWFKAFTMVLAVMFINIYKKSEFHYYHSHGLSKTLLWTVTLLFDFILFLYLFELTNAFR